MYRNLLRLLAFCLGFGVLLIGSAPREALAQDTDDVVPRQDEPDEQHDVALEAAARATMAEPSSARSGWAAVPLATYAPETHLGLGAFGAYFFRPPGTPTVTRPSSVAMVGFFTTRGQAIVELLPEFYFDREKWHLWTKWDYRNFPDSFWGIGNDTPENAERRFDQVAWHGRAWMRRRVAADLYLGLHADAQHLTVNGIEGDDGENVVGSEGGRTIGVGPTLGWDTRDSAVDTRSGGFYQARFMTFGSWLGSEYVFNRLAVDLRHFFPLGGSHTLGVQLVGEFNDGDVPFQRMAFIGGQLLMRGYFEGRYRDKNLLATQAEYRFPLFWRLRGVAFASVGDVAGRLGDIDFRHFEVAGGTGLRFALHERERLNLRVDLGVGINTWGVYVGFAETF